MWQLILATEDHLIGSNVQRRRKTGYGFMPMPNVTSEDVSDMHLNCQELSMNIQSILKG